MGPEEEEILEEIGELLDGPYTTAKRTHIWAEQVSAEHNWLAMTNFRDSLDHMSKILAALENGECERAEENLYHMKEHIHRAAFDSAHSAVEKELNQVMENRTKESIYKVLFLNHMSDDDFYNRKDIVRGKIEKGRGNKANSLADSIKKFRSAHEHAERMKRGTPSKEEVYFRTVSIFALLITVASGSLAIYKFL